MAGLGFPHTVFRDFAELSLGRYPLTLGRYLLLQFPNKISKTEVYQFPLVKCNIIELVVQIIQGSC